MLAENQQHSLPEKQWGPAGAAASLRLSSGFPSHPEHPVCTSGDSAWRPRGLVLSPHASVNGPFSFAPGPWGCIPLSGREVLTLTSGRAEWPWQCLRAATPVGLGQTSGAFMLLWGLSHPTARLPANEAESVPMSTWAPSSAFNFWCLDIPTHTAKTPSGSKLRATELSTSITFSLPGERIIF